jgi:protoporphyrinogen oxidase
VVVLGAGPAGLAAACRLAEEGRNPIIIERSPLAGGLMRGIQHDDFHVDFGRKEIYERFPEVTALWEDLLGDDFVSYPHRIGLLYQNRVLDYSPKFRGPGRGIPFSFLASCFSGFVRARIAALGSPPPANYEERWYQAWGKPLTMMAAQGFSEKFYGVPWKDRPVQFNLRRQDQHKDSKSLIGNIKALYGQIFGNPDAKRHWRHPRYSTQQFIDRAVARIEELGGTFLFSTAVSSLSNTGQQVDSLVLKHGDDERALQVDQLVSTVPMLALASLLGLDKIADPIKDRNQSRETFFLYLFLNRPPRFSHAWLNVSCPDKALGRVVNYDAFGGSMVPEGKGCICLELFTLPGDGFAEKDNDTIANQLIGEAKSASLIQSKDIADRKIIRIPGAEASNEFQTWQDEKVQGLQAQFREYTNLYEANRAGMDIAAFAGICAAEAVISGSRTRFDEEASPDKVPGWSPQSGAAGLHHRRAVAQMRRFLQKKPTQASNQGSPKRQLSDDLAQG